MDRSRRFKDRFHLLYLGAGSFDLLERRRQAPNVNLTLAFRISHLWLTNPSAPGGSSRSHSDVDLIFWEKVAPKSSAVESATSVFGQMAHY